MGGRTCYTRAEVVREDGARKDQDSSYFPSSSLIQALPVVGNSSSWRLTSKRWGEEGEEKAQLEALLIHSLQISALN